MRDVPPEKTPVQQSISQIDTAVPAFVGYTRRAMLADEDDLVLHPTRITSLEEFERSFGASDSERVTMTIEGGARGGYSVTSLRISEVAVDHSFVPAYLLHSAVRMYFENGGAACYVVSVKSCPEGDPVPELDGGNGLRDGLGVLEHEDEPTLVVIPEAVKLPVGDYSALVQATLSQCARLGYRFAILDALAGEARPNAAADVPDRTRLEVARDAFGSANLAYGAAYYPFLATSPDPLFDETAVTVETGGGAGGDPRGTGSATLADLRRTDPAFHEFAAAALAACRPVVPPSAAVAGVYAATDAVHGVWKPPADVPLADAAPVVELTDAVGDELAVDAADGRSINAVRAFPGKGTTVWGARTLAGSDPDWRYVSIRRLFSIVEESVRRSTSWAVFEPNDATTWGKITAMINEYLTRLWRDGALAGNTSPEAFFVRCGLGATMSDTDLARGRMVVLIGMAAIRPSEFTTIEIAYRLQTA